MEKWIKVAITIAVILVFSFSIILLGLNGLHIDINYNYNGIIPANDLSVQTVQAQQPTVAVTQAPTEASPKPESSPA